LEFFKGSEEKPRTSRDLVDLEQKINNFNQTLFDYKKFKPGVHVKDDNLIISEASRISTNAWVKKQDNKKDKDLSSDNLSLEEDHEEVNFKPVKAKPEFITFSRKLIKEQPKDSQNDKDSK
jgi:hypothetical protein